MLPVTKTFSITSAPIDHAPPDGGTCEGPPDWKSLPPGVLGRCLLASRRKNHRFAAFPVCRTFAKAILTSAATPRIVLELPDDGPNSIQPGLVPILRWLVDCQVFLHVVLTKKNGEVSIQPLLRLLFDKGISLTTVTSMDIQGLLLDSCAPASLDAVFPNLRCLGLQHCERPACVLPLSGCLQLQELCLHSAQPHQWPPRTRCEAWLVQLSDLPSLDCLSIDEHEWPTEFIPALAGQLTKLALTIKKSSRHSTDIWQTPLEYASQCTSLHTVCLSPCTPNDIHSIASLSQLRNLELKISDYQPDDTLISAILQHLSQLTAVSFDWCSRRGSVSQTFADHPCGWRQLRLNRASPELLASLPLHSLTLPLQLNGLDLNSSDLTVAEVHAAVANLKRSQAPYVAVWNNAAPDGCVDIVFAATYAYNPEGAFWNSYKKKDNSPAALLRAAAPLVPQDSAAFSVRAGEADAELMTSLWRALPSATTSLDFTHSTIRLSFWPEAARLFPHLNQLSVRWCNPVPSVGEILSYYVSAAKKLPQNEASSIRAPDIELVVWRPVPGALEYRTPTDYDHPIFVAAEALQRRLREVREYLRLARICSTVTLKILQSS